MSLAVTVLGSGSATPTTKRFPSAQVIHHAGRCFLIDCGEGTQIQFRNLGIRFSRLDAVFISHLHGDHYFGLPGLINTLSLLGRTRPLSLVAAPELIDILDLQFKVAQTKLGFKLNFTSLLPLGKSLVFENQSIEVFSFPLMHRIPTCGFVFNEKQMPICIKRSFINRYFPEISEIQKIKNGADFTLPSGDIIPNAEITEIRQKQTSYVYCSDTQFDSSIVNYFHAPDLLYHEATYADDKKDQANLKFHSTARQAAEIAQLCKAKKLMIGHFSARYDNVDLLLKEAQLVFPETIAAIEGNTITV